MPDPATTAPHRDLDPDELVDWPRRLERDVAFVERVLTDAPSKRLLDLGSGSGHHARRLAERGWEVVAIEAVEERILRAQEAPGGERVQFLLGDIGAVERLVRGHFGGAICLGNTLPHLLSAESVSRLLVGLRRRLLPGAPLVVELVNYDRVFEHGGRALPIERLPGENASGERGETVVVRLLDPRDEGIVLHTTTALAHRPATDPPLELLGTLRSQLRGWQRAELETLLDVARFEVEQVSGGTAGEPFDPARSSDMVVVAR